ncbi:MAG TPA: energy transducer TonB [bacterium]|nr:energy transducer TonB [bacterium]
MKLSFEKALLLSLLLHGLAYGAGLGWMAWRERADESMDIDLSRSTLIPMLANLQGKRAPKPEEDWVMDTGRKLAPQQQKPLSPSAQAEEAPAGPPCPPPCPSNAGDWAPASAAVRRPEWTDGMISESDYPTEARYKNQTGKVVAEVLLDSEGKVREVQLLQGSYESLDDKTLEKLRAARFTPCMDANGKPFPCRLRLPIVWSLD